MARFNQTHVVKADTKNLAGGSAYTMSVKSEISNLILTSLLQDTHYESNDAKINRLKNLFNKLDDKKFLGKLAIYARKEHGLRSRFRHCLKVKR